MASAKQETAVQLAKVSPAYLHSNSTCHTWPFSAVAGLIDNACDPDVSAKEMRIDVETINGKDCLVFKDNGSGMNYEKIHKMLSFGFNEKEAIGRFQPIGRYGNGFKSGSMRLGDDALVITRCPRTTSVGFLSQTYLLETKAETVMVPIVTWTISGDSERVMQALPENKESLKAILQHSLFKTQEEIDLELDSLTTCGTKIIIYNLKRGTPANYELDFLSDPADIRYPETATLDTSTPDRPISVPRPEYRKSLRKYCSILYKKPRLNIFLRGKEVLCTSIESCLYQKMKHVYKPKYCKKAHGIKMTFGYTKDKDKDPEAYGLMLYHNNRLIKAYKKVGSQSTGSPESIGVLGIVKVNFLQPNNIKQNFLRDGKYSAFMAQAARNLNNYVNEQIYGKVDSTAESDEDDWRWVQCDKCNSFRRLPRDYKDELPDNWFCHMNPDSMYNRCELPEEPFLQDEEEVKPYKETFKKQDNCEGLDELFWQDEEAVKPYEETFKKQEVQRFAAKRKSGDLEGSETRAKMPNVVSTTITSSNKSANVSGDTSGDNSLVIGTSPGCEGRTDCVGGRRLQIQSASTDLSVEVAAVNLLQQKMFHWQKIVEEKDAEIRKEMHELMTLRMQNVEQKKQLEQLNISLEQSETRYEGAGKRAAKLFWECTSLRRKVIQREQSLKRLEGERKIAYEKELIKKETELSNLLQLRKTDQEVMRRLHKEKEEATEKINQLQRDRQMWLSEKRNLITAMEGLKNAEDSLQQQIRQWKD